jgi:hypothetical protein
MLSSPFIIPIVAIVGGISLSAFLAWIKHREKMASHAGTDGKWQTEINAVKARIEVLERLVTDRKEQLKRDIDGL